MRQVVGPWPASPPEALPYLGEAVRIDWDGPPPMEEFGLALWLELVERAAEARDDLDPSDRSAWRPGEVTLDWCPDQIAVGRPELALSLFDFDAGRVVTTTLFAAGPAFTKQALLWKVLDAQHRLGRCNDRVFEGLSLDEDGRFFVEAGS